MRPRRLGAILSQIGHLAVYSANRRRNQLDKAALIISVDVDVGCKLVGDRNRNWRARIRDKGARVHDYLSESKVGEIEEIAIPCLLRHFEELEMPVTFAMRGQLTETDGFPIDLIRQSSVKHDIGAHGYYHRVFTSLSHLEAENELDMISKGMKKFNIEPKSFVFPRNKVAHLDLLEKYGYRCYRDSGGLRFDGMFIQKHGNLYDVHPSFFLGSSPFSLCLNTIVDVAIKYKSPFHIWFHPSDFGYTYESIQKRISLALRPVLTYARKKNRKDELSLETMHSVIEKLDSSKAWMARA